MNKIKQFIKLNRALILILIISGSAIIGMTLLGCKLYDANLLIQELKQDKEALGKTLNEMKGENK